MRSSVKNILLTMCLGLAGSPSFLFIKLAVTHLPPLYVATGRIGIGALLLYLIMKIKGNGFPKEIKMWGHFFVMGLIATAIPFSLYCFAETTIDSSLGAILNGTAPMFTALFSPFFIRDERLTFQKSLGVFFSVLGLVLLSFPNLSIEGNTLGMMAALGATFSYSMSYIYGKKFLTNQKPFVAPAGMLLSSFIILTPITFFIDHPLSLAIPPLSACLGVCGLGVFGTALAFFLMYTLLEKAGPTSVSLAACLFPVGGLALGTLFLQESFTLGALFATSLILLGMLLANQIFYRTQKIS